MRKDISVSPPPLCVCVCVCARACVCGDDYTEILYLSHTHTPHTHIDGFIKYRYSSIEMVIVDDLMEFVLCLRVCVCVCLYLGIIY